MVMETLPSGTILHGRYRIERALGSGGFGHVYLAIDEQTRQQYALKEYLVTGASGQAQLKHESQVLGQLHHPNLPAFLEAFDERGRYYVVLGYIEGNDLTDYIRIVRQRNDTIPIQRIMNWILSICDAVIFLHRQQPPIIHRDIKPDNIRIMSNGTAVLVDLGNAKAAADGARTLFFIRHQGTPGYAPLEQYPGGTGTDERSDVYALGATLYFALTAHEPPSVSTRNQAVVQGLPDLPSLRDRLRNNPPESSLEPEVGRQFRFGSKPPRPAPRHSRHLAQLGMLPPPLLDQLDRIIQRAMAMKPNERYQAVADFSNDLRQVLAAIPSNTQPPASGAARPPDPHSTQPDLPFLYESMQAAKENQDAGARGPSDPPVSPSSSQSESRVYCPRCNAELVPHAVFCPHCGTSLTNRPRSNAIVPPPPIPKTNNNPSSHNNAMGPTAMITPQIKAQARAPITGTSRAMPKTSPSPTLEPPPNIVSLPGNPAQQNIAPPRPSTFPKAFMQATPPLTSGQPVSQVPPTAPRTPLVTTTGPNGQTKTIILLALILLILVLIGILLLFFITHKTATLGLAHLSSIQQYFVQAVT